MQTRRTALLSPIALAAGSGWHFSRSAVAAVVWRIVTEYPATAIPGEGIATFAEAATRRSAGALLVRPESDSIRSSTMIAAVSGLQVDAADAFTGALAAEAAIFQLSALPFLTQSAADTARLLAAARPAYARALEMRGLTLLYATPWPPSGIWSRVPLQGADALKGLRIRTYDAASTAVLRAAGATPVQISFTDAVPRLRAGEMDAVLSSGDGGAGARLWELLPNFAVLNYAYPLSLAFCNTPALNTLPSSARQAVMEAAAETEIRQFRAMENRQTENDVRMRANGVSISEVPETRAALVVAAASVVADWTALAGAEGSEILRRYRAAPTL